MESPALNMARSVKLFDNLIEKISHIVKKHQTFATDLILSQNQCYFFQLLLQII